MQWKIRPIIKILTLQGSKITLKRKCRKFLKTRAAMIHRTHGHSRYDPWRTSVSYRQPHFRGFANFLEPVIIKKISKYWVKSYQSQNLFWGHAFPLKFCVVSMQWGNQFRQAGSQWIQIRSVTGCRFPICIECFVLQAGNHLYWYNLKYQLCFIGYYFYPLQDMAWIWRRMISLHIWELVNGDLFAYT